MVAVYTSTATHDTAAMNELLCLKNTGAVYLPDPESIFNTL